MADRLVLGALYDSEETAFVEFDVDSDADIILGYDWLRAHGDRTFLYDADEVCFCAERGCTSGRSIRLNLTLAAPTSPAQAAIRRGLSSTEAHIWNPLRLHLNKNRRLLTYWYVLVCTGM